jgi:chromosome segregation ATPase
VLEGKIQKLKAELKKKKDELEDAKNQHKHIEQKLTEANKSLNAELEELADSLVRTKQLMQERELAMTKIQQKLTSDLENAHALIKRKIPFDDTRIEAYNALNVPTFDKTIEVPIITLDNSFTTSKNN